MIPISQVINKPNSMEVRQYIHHFEDRLLLDAWLPRKGKCDEDLLNGFNCFRGFLPEDTLQQKGSA